ncbi:MAG: hypothetical protein AB7H90_15805 [Alphaproteobacteria bacterium]
MDALLGWMEGLNVAVRVRTGAWPFAIANTGHVVGIALLFGGIAVLDLRLLGAASRSLDIAKLARLVLPVAVFGFGLTAATGVLMFVANAREYWAHPLFAWKLALIAAAGTNALLLHLTSWRRREFWGARVPLSARVAGLASLGLWLGAIACGRLMAYF